MAEKQVSSSITDNGWMVRVVKTTFLNRSVAGCTVLIMIIIWTADSVVHRQFRDNLL